MVDAATDVPEEGAALVIRIAGARAAKILQQNRYPAEWAGRQGGRAGLGKCCVEATVHDRVQFAVETLHALDRRSDELDR
jgi:hypothetical protein